MDDLCYLSFVFVKLSCLFIAALWSPAGKGLTSWFLFVMFNCVFVTFPCGILGQVWYVTVGFLTFAFFLTLKLLTHWKAFPQSEFLSHGVYSGGMLQTVDNSNRC